MELHDDTLQLKIIGEKEYEVMEPFVFQYITSKPIETIIFKIEKGFQCDLASIPRSAWSIMGIFPVSKSVIHASLVHDWLYRSEKNRSCERITHLALCDMSDMIDLNRRDADKIFAGILRQEGVPKWKRRVLYAVVRLFGWLYYKGD